MTDAEKSSAHGKTPTVAASGPRRTHTISGRWPVVVMALAAGLLIGRFACGGRDSPATGASEPATVEASVWTCAMDPQIRLPEPGKCPICAMDLVPVRDSADDDLGPRTLALSESAAALAEIVTVPVERRAVTREVRMVGRVAYDETLLASITARVAGWLERLFVDYTGVTVRAGDHMVEMYSPELITTQQHLLQAVEAAGRLGDGAVPVVADTTAAAVLSARERLRQFGLEAAQIDEIIERGEPMERVTLNAPIGGIVVHKDAIVGSRVESGTHIYTIADLTSVWVVLQAYESDLTWLHYGQDVSFTAEAHAGKTFHGRVTFIDPVLDDRTRTVKVRVNVDNAELILKPDMFVRATVQARVAVGGRVVDAELVNKLMCPMHPEVVSDEGGSCSICGMALVSGRELGFVEATEGRPPLVIPSSAPMITGKRAVVYVRLPGDRPVFQGREVVLGPRAGDVYVVEEGLREGELVVVQGAFKIDSELQIRAQPSMMSPEGGRAPTHEHGDHGKDD